jgi:predicted short-subunit dehydrogenase-like oxidoreductase (DUF2520 family)
MKREAHIRHRVVKGQRKKQEALHSVAIVGTGHVGTSLAKALRTKPKGFQLHSFLASRNSDFKKLSLNGGPEVLIIAARDADIRAVSKRAVSAAGSNLKLIVHLAGSQPPTILPNIPRIATLTFHPIQTFAEPSPNLFREITFVASSESASAIRWAQAFAEALGATDVLVLQTDVMPLYHATIVMGSNFITLLESAVEDLSTMLGIAPTRLKEAMAPLARTSLENAIANTAIEVLTGPIKRNDRITIQVHRKALKKAPTEIQAIYEALLQYGEKRVLRKRSSKQTPLGRPKSGRPILGKRK